MILYRALFASGVFTTAALRVFYDVLCYDTYTNPFWCRVLTVSVYFAVNIPGQHFDVSRFQNLVWGTHTILDETAVAANCYESAAYLRIGLLGERYDTLKAYSISTAGILAASMKLSRGIGHASSRQSYEHTPLD